MFNILLVFLLGASIGSFLNVIVYRVYKKQSFVTGRSRCPKCNKQISSKDLVPLFSYLWIKGKCRFCKNKISIEYFVVELLAGLIFVGFFLKYFDINFVPYNENFSNSILFLARDWLIICYMFVVFLYDLKHFIILDKVVFSGLILFFLFNLGLGYNLNELVLSALGISGFFAFQYYISKGKWIGGGDVKFGLLMGVILGWPESGVALLLSYWIGAIVGVFLIMIGKKKLGSQLPFGTFLAVSVLFTMYCSQLLIDWYLQFLYL